ncbi:MAG: glycosyltransferase family 4 protein [Thermoplasmata archaeon]
MKVLFVGAQLDKGGGEAFQSLQIFHELRKSVEGDYLCLRSVGPHYDLLEQEGIRVVGRLRMPQGIWDLRSAIQAERGDWDIVQLFDVYFALPAAYLARAFPRAVLFGIDPITELGWRYGTLGYGAAKFGLPVLLRETKLLVNSPVLAESFLPYSPTFIPNGVDVTRLGQLPEKAEARRLLGLDPKARIIHWLGKAIYAKRIEWLFETLRRIPDSLLVAVGGFNEEHYGDRYLRDIQARYSDVAARARFVGEVPTPQVALYLAAADVFAFPSRFEGMPNALMEAMAAGLPVVASDIPAHRVLIRPRETGFLARDPIEFAEMVSALLSDPALASQIGLRAQEFVREEFTFDRISRRYLELYRGLLAPA